MKRLTGEAMVWFKKLKNVRRPESGTPRLERMVRVCREEREEPLSADARERIVTAVRQAVAPRPLPSLFTPTRRLVLTGSLPLLLGGLFLLSVDNRVTAPELGGEGPPVVRVSKQGDQVLFQISNGGRAHYVSRSTRPNRFEPSSKVRVENGAYAERLQDRESLVFYRID